VYSRTGGHAYDSVYPGPIGAILTPQLRGTAEAGSLPFASSLCGACAEVCPVKIDIPQVLVHLRARVVREEVGRLDPERLAMTAAARALGGSRRLRLAHWLGRWVQEPFADRDQRVRGLPGFGAWTRTRDLPAMPARSFRDWWRDR
jgi:L-lactate dehydrogenase complex protein LldF